jgi:hypothetical protein
MPETLVHFHVHVEDQLLRISFIKSHISQIPANRTVYDESDGKLRIPHWNPSVSRIPDIIPIRPNLMKRVSSSRLKTPHFRFFLEFIQRRSLVVLRHKK